MSKVSIVRCQSYERGEVEARLEEAVSSLGGWGAFIKPGEKVLLKPNMLVGAPPERVISTHPEVLRAAIRGCQAQGAEVWVGDSPGFGDATKAAARCGFIAVCQEMGVPFRSLFEGSDVSFPDGRVTKRFRLGTPVQEADKVISLAKLKTHGLTLYTGAVKNLYGTVAGGEKVRMHLVYQDKLDFSRMLLDLYRLLRPVLSIVDGVVGMEGDGPRSGKPRQVGLLLAGADAVALDAVGASIIGLRPEQVPYLAAAIEVGEGVADLERIEVLGLPLAQARVPGYKLPPTVQIMNYPRWMGRLGRRYLTARPVVIPDLCIGCAICQESCPPQTIAMEGKKARIDDSRCIRCYCCQEMCPQGAIQLRQGPLGRFWKWR